MDPVGPVLPVCPVAPTTFVTSQTVTELIIGTDEFKIVLLLTIKLFAGVESKV